MSLLVVFQWAHSVLYVICLPPFPFLSDMVNELSIHKILSQILKKMKLRAEVWPT